MAESYLDWDVIQRTPLAAEPFRYALWREAIPPVMARRLTDEFPTDGFVRSERRSGGDKTYRFLVRKAVEKNRLLPSVESLSPAWQAFLGVLTGPDYRTAVGEKIGECLHSYQIDVGFFVFTTGDEISIHTDHLTKASTNVLYFGNRWEPGWGGQLNLCRKKADGRFESFAHLSPVTGNGMLLVPSLESWHEVSAVSPAAQAARLTVQIEAWRPAPEMA